MGFHRGPNIVTEGLKLSLDAGNEKSYPGTGTIWYDKSGNGFNGTLINGPIYSPTDGGSIVFDGVNDYIRIPDSPSLNTNATPFTVEMCIKLPSNIPTSSQYLYTKLTKSFVLYLYNNRLYIGKDNVNDWVNISVIPYLNNILYISVGWDGVNKFCYFNGTNVLNSAQSTFLIESTVNPLYLGGIGNTSFNGSMFLLRNYSRALTAEEVLQNYNATKGRFEL